MKSVQYQIYEIYEYWRKNVKYLSISHFYVDVNIEVDVNI